ncbi:Ribokinase-like protein [Gloeopeniophorella convolvens]|nr:Ribokinase-like protein [Gloeopeniophorella convolvens]
MSSQPARCLVRGSLNIDEFFHVQDIVRPGQTISSTKFERRSGGKGANQAAAVARAGGAVRLVGAVGDDGAWLVRGLARYGVDVGGVSVVPEATGRAIIQLTPEGENCIILHKGANHALPDPPAASLAAHLADTTHLLLQNEIPWPSTLAYLSTAHARGAATVFNPSPMPTAAELRAFPWAQLTWLVVNEGEAASLLRALCGDAGSAEQEQYHADWPDDMVLPAAFATLGRLAHCETLAATSVVCTLGATGVLASVRGLGETLYVPAAKLQGDVRDTTGAGDCFTGYFVAGLMQSGEERLSADELTGLLRHSVQAAGMCVEKNGAMESIPERAEVEARLSGR